MNFGNLKCLPKRGVLDRDPGVALSQPHKTTSHHALCRVITRVAKSSLGTGHHCPPSGAPPLAPGLEPGLAGSGCWAAPQVQSAGIRKDMAPRRDRAGEGGCGHSSQGPHHSLLPDSAGWAGQAGLPPRGLHAAVPAVWGEEQKVQAPRALMGQGTWRTQRSQPLCSSCCPELGLQAGHPTLSSPKSGQQGAGTKTVVRTAGPPGRS